MGHSVKRNFISFPTTHLSLFDLSFFFFTWWYHPSGMNTASPASTVTVTGEAPNIRGDDDDDFEEDGDDDDDNDCSEEEEEE
jgi:hypothetical protein